MEKLSEAAARSPLFAGIEPGDLPALLVCLNARRAHYPKQTAVLREGEPVPCVGLVLEGRLQISKEDFMGNRNILAEAEPGDLFAEAYAFGKTEHFPLTVASASESAVLWLESRRIVASCASACPFHARLVENMLSIVSGKNILLNRKIEHISRRTTREKVLAYLSDQAALHGAREFAIPFDRQELADYLCVDRSALSTELGNMQKEGALRFSRNRFTLLSD